MLSFAAAPHSCVCAACGERTIPTNGLCVVAYGDPEAVRRGEGDAVSRPICMRHFQAAGVEIDVPAFLPPATGSLLAALRHRERIGDTAGAADVRRRLALQRLPEETRQTHGRRVADARARLRDALRAKHHQAARAARGELLALRRGVLVLGRAEEAALAAASDRPPPTPLPALLRHDRTALTAAEVREAIGERVVPVKALLRGLRERVPKELRPALLDQLTAMAQLSVPVSVPGRGTERFMKLKSHERALLRGQRRWRTLRAKFWAQGDLARRAKLQAKVDLWLLRHELADWMDAKRRRRERAR